MSAVCLRIYRRGGKGAVYSASNSVTDADLEMGSAQTSVDTGADYFSDRRCGRVDGLKLDWGEFAQPSLSAFAVVFRLDPGHDRQPQLLAGAPPTRVKNVLLQQGKERLHRGVVTTRADPAHRPGQPVSAQQTPVAG